MHEAGGSGVEANDSRRAGRAHGIPRPIDTGRRGTGGHGNAAGRHSRLPALGRTYNKVGRAERHPGLLRIFYMSPETNSRAGVFFARLRRRRRRQRP